MRKAMMRCRFALIAFAIALTLTAMPAEQAGTRSTAGASSHTVIVAETVADLIAAINTANSSSEPVAIELSEGKSYVVNGEFATRLPRIEGDVTIHGNGATVQGFVLPDGFPVRANIFRVAARGALHLDDVTVSEGFERDGAGIHSLGTLTLTNSTVRGNLLDDGGGAGIFTGGSTTLINSTITGNFNLSGDDAGIYQSWGTLTLINSSVIDNFEPFAGRAHRMDGIVSSGSLTLIGSTVSGNGNDGIVSAGTLSIINSTVANNGGHGIRTVGMASVTNSTISGNAMAGIFNEGSPIFPLELTLTGTLVANNGGAGASDIQGHIIDGGHNLLGDPTGSSGLTHDVNGNILGVDPMLADLEDNGGPTKTIALLPGSPAIGAIPIDQCTVSTDQRDIERPQGTGCDIGAFELEQEPEQPTISDLHEATAQMDLPQGTERSLQSQIGAAGASLERGNTEAACGQLGAFINSVGAQSGKHLSEEQANFLAGAAEQIRNGLGC